MQLSRGRDVKGHWDNRAGAASSNTQKHQRIKMGMDVEPHSMQLKIVPDYSKDVCLIKHSLVILRFLSLACYTRPETQPPKLRGDGQGQ